MTRGMCGPATASCASPPVPRAGMGTRCALVFAGDENYGIGLAVAVRSAIEKLSSACDPEIYVLDNSLSAGSRARLSKVVQSVDRGERLRWIHIPGDRLRGLPSHGWVTTSSYSRLFIADLLPADVSRAIYLDADVLVRRDLSPLFTLPLGEACVAAVRDYVVTSTADERCGVRDRSEPRPYFNAGVLVIDVPCWRRLELGQRALAYVGAGEPLRLMDQDALNAVVNIWAELDYRWNVQQPPDRLFAADYVRPEMEARLYKVRWKLYRAAAVVHFLGNTKPWHHSCTTAGTTGWVHALVRTGWYSPTEMLMWLLRWHARRIRYRIGTARRGLMRPSG